MQEYKHIKVHEETLDFYEEKVKELRVMIDSLDDKFQAYQDLVSYYYSDSWTLDFDDDARDLIPKDLKRGVLSEDGIYNVLSEVNDLSLNLIELGVKYLKV